MEIIKKTKHGNLIILLDDDIYNSIKENNYSICIQNSNRKNPYAYLQKYINGKCNRILLHRYILNPGNDKVVDHINHNTLDNRNCNLRICTTRENCGNMITNTSGVAGVGFHKSSNKWRAYYNIKDKQISLGYFDTKEEAIKARRKFESLPVVVTKRRH